MILKWIVVPVHAFPCILAFVYFYYLCFLCAYCTAYILLIVVSKMQGCAGLCTFKSMS